MKIVIYSPSRCFKPVWVFFCWAQKKLQIKVCNVVIHLVDHNSISPFSKSLLKKILPKQDRWKLALLHSLRGLLPTMQCAWLNFVFPVNEWNDQIAKMNQHMNKKNESNYSFMVAFVNIVGSVYCAVFSSMLARTPYRTLPELFFWS